MLEIARRPRRLALLPLERLPQILAGSGNDLLFRKETTRLSLRFHHFPEFALIALVRRNDKFQIGSEPLFNHSAIFEDVNKILGSNLREVVGNDNRRHVLPPSLESFEDENSRC